MNITKIKYNGDVVAIYQSKEDFNNSKDYKIASRDEPLDSFNDALQALKEDVVEICEFPSEYVSSLKIVGISISWDEAKCPGRFMGATITALRELEYCNSPMVINTPWLPTYQFNDANENPQLHTWTIQRIDWLMSEAERYLQGHRKVEQMGLFEAA